MARGESREAARQSRLTRNSPGSAWCLLGLAAGNDARWPFGLAARVTRFTQRWTLLLRMQHESGA